MSSTSILQGKKALLSGGLSMALGAGMLFAAPALAMAADVSGTTFNVPASSPSEPLVLLTTGTAEAPKAGQFKAGFTVATDQIIPAGAYTVTYQSEAGDVDAALTCDFNLPGVDPTLAKSVGGETVSAVMPDDGTSTVGTAVNCTVSVPVTEDHEIGDEKFTQGNLIFAQNGDLIDAFPVYAVAGNNLADRYEDGWKPEDSANKYDWVEPTADADLAIPNLGALKLNPSEDNASVASVEVPYTDLVPEANYQITIEAFDRSGKKVSTVTQEFTPTAEAGKETVATPDFVAYAPQDRYTFKASLALVADYGTPVLDVTEAVFDSPLLQVYSVDANDKTTVLTGGKYTGWVCRTVTNNAAIVLEDEEVDGLVKNEISPNSVENSTGVECESLDKYNLTMDNTGDLLRELNLAPDGSAFVLLEETQAPEGYEDMHDRIVITPTENGTWAVDGGDGAWVDPETGAIYLPSTKEAAVTPTPTPTEPTPTPTPTDPEPTPTPTEPTPTPTEPEPTEPSTPTPTTSAPVKPTNNPPSSTAPVANKYLDSGLNYYDDSLAKTGSDISPVLLALSVALLIGGGALVGGSMIVSRRRAEANTE